MVVQFGAGLIRSPPLSLEERLPIESHLTTKYVIDGTGQLLGQYGQGFAFVMFFSRRARYFCAAGWFLRNKAAASEKAHFR
jgi:hypothetical protein